MPVWWSLLAKSEAGGLVSTELFEPVGLVVKKVEFHSGLLRVPILGFVAAGNRGGLGADGPTPSSSEGVSFASKSIISKKKKFSTEAPTTQSDRPEPPDDRVAEAQARVIRLQAAVDLLGEDNPDAASLKTMLAEAKAQTRVAPVGE